MFFIHSGAATRDIRDLASYGPMTAGSTVLVQKYPATPLP